MFVCDSVFAKPIREERRSSGRGSAGPSGAGDEEKGQVRENQNADAGPGNDEEAGPKIKDGSDSDDDGGSEEEFDAYGSDVM